MVCKKTRNVGAERLTTKLNKEVILYFRKKDEKRTHDTLSLFRRTKQMEELKLV